MASYNPVVQSVKFGSPFGCLFDIGLEGINGIMPWTVQHMEGGLAQKYNTCLERIYKGMPNTLKSCFALKWLKNHHSPDSPALIPSVYGFGNTLCYYVYKGGIYQNCSELSLGTRWDEVQRVNFCIDFAVISPKNNKIVILDKESGLNTRAAFLKKSIEQDKTVSGKAVILPDLEAFVKEVESFL